MEQAACSCWYAPGFDCVSFSIIDSDVQVEVSPNSCSNQTAAATAQLMCDACVNAGCLRSVEDQAKQADEVVCNDGTEWRYVQPDVEEFFLGDEHIPGQQGADTQYEQYEVHEAKPAAPSTIGKLLSITNPYPECSKVWCRRMKPNLSRTCGCFIMAVHGWLLSNQRQLVGGFARETQGCSKPNRNVSDTFSYIYRRRPDTSTGTKIVRAFVMSMV